MVVLGRTCNILILPPHLPSFIPTLAQSDTQIPHDVMYLLKSVRVFGHFEKPLFMELCKHVETKFVPSGAILFRPGQVSVLSEA